MPRIMDAETAYHWDYGRHSGIPDCCIAFWLDKWEYESPNSYSAAVTASNYNYVPCPKCFEKKRKIHLIDCIYDCGQDCYKYYRNKWGL